MNIRKGLVFILSFFCLIGFAQQEVGISGSKNWFTGWTTIKPGTVFYPQTTKILTGNISADMKLTNAETYNIVGEVYVTNNAVLTIEPGTVIRANSEEYSALIITKGSKIIADGEVGRPIIFTSDKSENQRKQGDWGGIFILGNAPINTFGSFSKIESSIDPKFRVGGGPAIEDNSGSLKNVRIEFAGKSFNRKEIGGSLTLVGVGNKTTIKGVQSSFTDGNSFKVIGGNLVGSQLISYRSKNSDYEFTQGAQSKIDNAIAIRYAFFSASSSFRGVTIKEYENRDITDFSLPKTNVSLSFCTIVNETDGVSGTNGLIKEAMFLSKNCILSMKNSVVSGFSTALLFDKDFNIEENLATIKLEKVFINNCEKNITSQLGGVTDSDLEGFYAAASFGNVYEKMDSKELFLDAGNDRAPDYRIKIEKIR